MNKMAIIKAHLNYLGYGYNGGYLGISAVEQAESDKEIKKLGYWSSPKEKYI